MKIETPYIAFEGSVIIVPTSGDAKTSFATPTYTDI